MPRFLNRPGNYLFLHNIYYSFAAWGHVKQLFHKIMVKQDVIGPLNKLQNKFVRCPKWDILWLPHKLGESNCFQSTPNPSPRITCTPPPSSNSSDAGEGQGSRTILLFHISFQEQWTFPGEEVAVALVPLAEQGAFHHAGFVFKAEEFHGRALFGADNLAGDQPAQKTHRAPLADGGGRQVEQLLRGEGACSVALRSKQGDGMTFAEKTQHPVFVA